MLRIVPKVTSVRIPLRRRINRLEVITPLTLHLMCRVTGLLELPLVLFYFLEKAVGRRKNVRNYVKR